MRQTVRSLKERRSGMGMVLQSALRRMVVVGTSAVRWALEGFEDFDGNVEEDEAEPFTGVGFYSRPPSGDATEAVVLKIGGRSGHPVIVATRSHDGVKRVGAVGEDETLIFNSLSVVKITAAGEIQVGAIGGPFAPLATKADLDAIVLWLTAHVHTSTAPGNPTSPPTILPVPPPVGTIRLKAQ